MDEMARRAFCIPETTVINLGHHSKDLKKQCPGSLALIGVYGRFLTGAIHEKSLDLWIVVNDERGAEVLSQLALSWTELVLICTTHPECLWKRMQSTRIHLLKLMNSKEFFFVGTRPIRERLEVLQDEARQRMAGLSPGARIASLKTISRRHSKRWALSPFWRMPPLAAITAFFDQCPGGCPLHAQSNLLPIGQQKRGEELASLPPSACHFMNFHAAGCGGRCFTRKLGKLHSACPL